MSDVIERDLESTASADRAALHVTSTNLALPRVILVLAVVATFFQAFCYDFASVDDRNMIARNPLMNPSTVHSLRAWWTAASFGLYVPVTSTVQGGIALLAHVTPEQDTGDALNPWIFHGFNIFLHIAVTLLVYQILLYLKISPWPACAGALVFAIHPVQVEPVVWATSIKDLLYGLFGLLALWRLLISLASAEDVRPSTAGGSGLQNYLLATFCFVLAILSKPTAVALPFLALPLVWLQWRRVPRNAWYRLGVWVALAIPFCILAKHVQPAHLNVSVPLWQRPLVAADALAFYLGKVVWPRTLLLYYGRTPAYIVQHGFIWWTWIIPAALLAILFINRRRCAPALAGMMIFVAALLPVLGFVGFDFQYYSTVADRYLYLSMFGIALVVAWAVDRLPRLSGVVAAVLLVCLAGRSFLQVPYWRDSLELMNHVLDNDPGSAIANANVASELAFQHHYESAIDYARKSIALDPRRAETYVILAKALDRIGDTAAAAQAFRDGFRADRKTTELLHGYLVALIHEGDTQRAMVLARLAVELDPNAASYVELGAVLARTNDWQGARSQLQQAVALDPKDYDAQCILGSVLYHLGDRAGAIACYRAAEAIDPDFPAARQALERLTGARGP